MSILIGGIVCDRVPGFPLEDLSWGRIVVVDKLQCDWTHRISVAKTLLGYYMGSVASAPWHYDFYTSGISNVYVKEVSIEPVLGLKATTDPLGDYTLAQLTVSYQTAEMPEDGESIVSFTESIEPSSEYLSLGYTNLYWGTGANKVAINADEAPRVIIRMLDWVYTVNSVLTIPDWVWTHPGSVNDAAVYSRRFNKIFDAETLLCSNPSFERSFTTGGTTGWNITVRLTYKLDGWNKFWHVNASGNLVKEYIYNSAGNIKYFYPLISFTGMIY